MLGDGQLDRTAPYLPGGGKGQKLEGVLIQDPEPWMGCRLVCDLGQASSLFLAPSLSFLPLLEWTCF